MMMAEQLLEPTARQTRAEMKAQLARYIEELKRMNAQMAQDRAEGERLKAETRELRAKLRRAA
jgi:cell shape-determining protein MreC